jgi:hypothetical protein
MAISMRAVAALAVGCLLPTLAPAATTTLRCVLTREVSNPVDGAHVSFRIIRFVVIDPDAGVYREADESAKFWPNQCGGVGQHCQFTDKMVEVRDTLGRERAKTTIDRTTLQYSRESSNDVVLSGTYGRCVEVPAFEPTGDRKF